MKKITDSLNSKFRNNGFTNKKEETIHLLFWDILISRSESGFKSTVHHKPTFREVYSKVISDQCKISFISTLLIGMSTIVSDFVTGNVTGNLEQHYA